LAPWWWFDAIVATSFLVPPLIYQTRRNSAPAFTSRTFNRCWHMRIGARTQAVMVGAGAENVMGPLLSVGIFLPGAARCVSRSCDPFLIKSPQNETEN
jgi:hypothetical protein